MVYKIHLKRMLSVHRLLVIAESFKVIVSFSYLYDNTTVTGLYLGAWLASDASKLQI